MRYLLLMWGPDEDWTQHSEEELKPVMDGHSRLIDELRKVNAYVGGEALRPAFESRMITVNHDGYLLTDGPYVESKEQIGGFYIIDAENMDQAVEWGKKLADVNGGPVEVREVVDV